MIVCRKYMNGLFWKSCKDELILFKKGRPDGTYIIILPFLLPYDSPYGTFVFIGLYITTII